MLSAVLLLSACVFPLEPEKAERRGRLHRGHQVVHARAPGADAGRSTTSRADAAFSDDAASALTDPRWIFLDDLKNARDLGGTPLANGAHVADGALLRGPALAPLSNAGCREFNTRAIRTIIDLREPSERDTTPESACVEDVARIVYAPMPIPYNVSPDDYLADLHETPSVLAAFHVLGDAEAYPVYVHCTWGRDRTGVVVALVLLALGASRDVVLDEYMLSLRKVGAYPQSLIAVLNAVNREGGIDAYLEKIGVTPESLRVLRSRAVQAP